MLKPLAAYAKNTRLLDIEDWTLGFAIYFPANM